MLTDEHRDRVEQATADAFAVAVRRWLAHAQAWIRREFPTAALPTDEPPPSVTAAVTAGADDPMPDGAIRLFTMGEASGWWIESVDAAAVDAAVTDAFVAGWRDLADDVAVADRVAAEHMASVVDRLSRTAMPTIPAEGLDTIRGTLTQAAQSGWTVQRTAERIAVDMSWSPSGDWWRGERARADAALDALLDPYGPPGSPSREAARLADPEVAAWQRVKADATLALDRDESLWHTRAQRIARTETTAAVNTGSLAAAQAADVGVKVWIATGGPRTRDTHLLASGQCVTLDDTFIVGGDRLLVPGDPAGSAGETINCRCSMLYASSCEEAAGEYRSALSTVEDEADERGVAASSRLA